jgi:aromatic ring-cleaving dioxygenase
MMTDHDAPYHAHIYFTDDQRDTAEDLRTRFEAGPSILFVGVMTAGKAGPHPIPQYEVHFLKSSLDEVVKTIRESGLRALIHPLTDNDLADHTTLGEWIGGEPLELDLTTLDPPGINQGIARFGKSDF